MPKSKHYLFIPVREGINKKMGWGFAVPIRHKIKNVPTTKNCIYQCTTNAEKNSLSYLSLLLAGGQGDGGMSPDIVSTAAVLPVSVPSVLLTVIKSPHHFSVDVYYIIYYFSFQFCDSQSII